MNAVDTSILVEALEAALSVRPKNWADDKDPEQRRAWLQVRIVWERATGRKWD